MSLWSIFKSNRCRHHWHEVPDSYYKVPANKPYCKKDPTERSRYIREDVDSFGASWGTFIIVEYTEKCCNCEETQTMEASITGLDAIKEAIKRYPDVSERGLDEDQ